MTPEEFLAAIAAINQYMREAERPIEIREGPKYWKISARLVE